MINANAVKKKNYDTRKVRKIDKVRKNFKSEIFMYILLFPTLLYFFIFSYIPMYGVLVAFQDFSFSKGVFGSKWVGLYHFITFFKSMYFPRLVRNTVLFSVYSII